MSAKDAAVPVRTSHNQLGVDFVAPGHNGSRRTMARYYLAVALDLEARQHVLEHGGRCSAQLSHGRVVRYIGNSVATSTGRGVVSVPMCDG